MTDLNNWNRQIIEEFRAHAGKIGEQLAGASVIGSPLTGLVGAPPFEAKTSRKIPVIALELQAS